MSKRERVVDLGETTTAAASDSEGEAVPIWVAPYVDEEAATVYMPLFGMTLSMRRFRTFESLHIKETIRDSCHEYYLLMRCWGTTDVYTSAHYVDRRMVDELHRLISVFIEKTIRTKGGSLQG